MSDTAMVPRKPADGDRPARRPLIDDELADQLLGNAAAEGVELLGPDGLLSQVTKAVLERALAEEMTGHLGYDKHDPAGRGSGNSRNGTTGKTLLTDVGAVGPAVPRDRNGTFDPQIVRKGQTRLEGFNERILALYARGLTVAEPQRGVAFPGGGEPDRLGQLHITEPVRQQRHRAAALDGGELFLVAGQHQLAAVAGRVIHQSRQVSDRHHRALVH